MALGDIYLGAAGSEYLLTPFGRTLSIEPFYPKIRRDRASSGKAREDRGGVEKKKFTLSYSSIDGTMPADFPDYSALDDIIAIAAIDDELSLIIYTTASLHDHYTVLMDPVSRRRVLLLGDGLWDNVTVVLEEV